MIGRFTDRASSVQLGACISSIPGVGSYAAVSDNAWYGRDPAASSSCHEASGMLSCSRLQVNDLHLAQTSLDGFSQLAAGHIVQAEAYVGSSVDYPQRSESVGTAVVVEQFA